MMPSTTHDDHHPTLAQFLAGRARHASDGRLAIDLAAGCVVVIVLIFWQPVGWLPLVSCALCLASFGAWGIADRVLGERHASHNGHTRVLRFVRIASSVIGAFAAIVVLVSLLGIALGRWIS